MPTPLLILYRDDDYVAIHKPAGLLVHRTRIAQEQHHFALQQLRNQIKQRVYPVHRLDRATHGILLFALHKEAASLLVKDFQERKIHKEYLAIVRGFTPEQDTINYALTPENSQTSQEAITKYKRLHTIELPIAVDRYSTARYSLVRISPLTGRMHQIRKHFAHIRHPIIGDKKHGDRHHNRMFREKKNSEELLLLAHQLHFEHPFTKERISIKAKPSSTMQRFLDEFEWKIPEFI